jgi:hypothetical protein
MENKNLSAPELLGEHSTTAKMLERDRTTLSAGQRSTGGKTKEKNRSMTGTQLSHLEKNARRWRKSVQMMLGAGAKHEWQENQDLGSEQGRPHTRTKTNGGQPWIRN